MLPHRDDARPGVGVLPAAAFASAVAAVAVAAALVVAAAGPPEVVVDGGTGPVPAVAGASVGDEPLDQSPDQPPDQSPDQLADQPPADGCDSQVLPPPLAVRAGPGTAGVPAGTALTRVEGDLRTERDGQELRRLDVTGRLYVDHDDVTVTCSRVRRMTTSSGTGLRIWSSTLGDPAGVAEGSALRSSGYTLRRVEVVGTIDGLKASGDVDVRDSWIHDMFRTDDANQASGTTHNDAVQIGSGERMVFAHNTIDAWSFSPGEAAGAHLHASPYGDGAGYMTSAFIITDVSGPVRDVVVRDNLVRGRTSKPFIVAEKGGNGVSGVRIVDNVLGRANRDHPAVFAGADHATIRGNVFVDGEPATP